MHKRALAIRRIEVTSRTDELVRLYFITDTHLGNKATDEDTLRADIERVQEDPKAYWIGGGDMIEAISLDDRRRFDSRMVADWVEDYENITQEQVEYFLTLFRPIAHKCLALLRGNHEHSARKYSSFDPYKVMVQRMGEYAGMKWRDNDLALGWGDYLALRLVETSSGQRGTSRTLTLWCHHGSGGATSGLAGSYATSIQRAMFMRPSADIVLMGHRHVLAHHMEELEVTTKKYIESRKRMGMYMPGYMRGVVGKSGAIIPLQNYSEEKALKPVPIGVVPITIYPIEGTFEVTL